MLRKITLFTFASLAVSSAFAQMKVGASGAANVGAVLELSSSDRGLLMPRIALTTTTTWGLNGAAPIPGMTVFNTTAGITSSNASYPAAGIGEYYWDGTGWVSKKSAAATAYQEPWNVTGTTTPATTNNQNIYQLGRVGIGTSLPTGGLSVVAENDDNKDNVDIKSFGGGAPVYQSWKSGGTALAPVNLAGNESIGSMQFVARANGAWVTSANILANYRGDGTNNLGSLAFATSAANRMYINETGLVGINTLNPHSQLDLGTGFGGNTSALSGKKLAVYNDAAGNDFYGLGISSGRLQLHAASLPDEEPDMVVSGTGAVGIGTTNPTSLLSVNGTADKVGGGSWGSFSDARIKKNVKDYSAGLKEILAIHPVTFEYNGKAIYKNDGKKYVGVLAQEIEKVLPSTVSTIKADGFDDLRKYDGSELTYTLINAVKELQSQIEKLKAENLRLTAAAARVEANEKAVASLADQIKTLQELVTGGKTQSQTSAK